MGSWPDDGECALMAIHAHSEDSMKTDSYLGVSCGGGETTGVTCSRVRRDSAAKALPEYAPDVPIHAAAHAPPERTFLLERARVLANIRSAFESGS